MDSVLQTLWQAGERPFTGETIYPAVDVYVRDAIVAIPAALAHLAQHYPNHQLFAFDDWHEHDGFLVTAKPTTIEVLREQVSSPENYVSNHSDDTAVYRAVYPASLDLLLRYSLWDADEPDQDKSDRQVHWTFTGYGRDVAEIRKRWSAYKPESVPSAKYFAERQAG